MARFGDDFELGDLRRVLGLVRFAAGAFLHLGLHFALGLIVTVGCIFFFPVVISIPAASSLSVSDLRVTPLPERGSLGRCSLTRSKMPLRDAMLAFMGTTNEFTRIAKQKPVHVTTIIAAVTILLPKELDKHAFADARNAGDNAFNSIVYNTGRPTSPQGIWLAEPA